MTTLHKVIMIMLGINQLCNQSVVSDNIGSLLDLHHLQYSHHFLRSTNEQLVASQRLVCQHITTHRAAFRQLPELVQYVQSCGLYPTQNKPALTGTSSALLASTRSLWNNYPYTKLLQYTIMYFVHRHLQWVFNRLASTVWSDNTIVLWTSMSEMAMYAVMLVQLIGIWSGDGPHCRHHHARSVSPQGPNHRLLCVLIFAFHEFWWESRTGKMRRSPWFLVWVEVCACSVQNSTRKSVSMASMLKKFVTRLRWRIKG